MLIKRILGVVVGGVLFLVVIAPAWASGTRAQHIVIISTGAQGTPSTAILSGAVTGVGSSVDTETQGTLTLNGGTIFVDHPVTASNDSFDPRSCILTIDESGPYTFTGGTGSFVGISGSGTYTTSGKVIFARGLGGCSQAPIASVVVVRASGTTTLP